MVTMLGTIKAPADLSERASYALSGELASCFSLHGSQYSNTLPIIVRLSQDIGFSLVPIATREALRVQRDVLEAEGLDYSCLEEAVIIEEDDFEATFATINTILGAADEVILDVSHGFRHLPILATVSMIIHNITHSEKIRHILFAKEIDPRKRYEIIDLRKYLDIANVTYVLHTFDRNYTVAATAAVRDGRLTELIRLLQEFSRHILANSLNYLVRGNNSLLNQIRERLQSISDSDDTPNQSFGRLLERVDTHIQKVQDCLQQERESLKFYSLARLLAERGYLLNSLTLLHEAIGSYTLESISDKSLRSHNHYEATKAARDVFLHPQKWHSTLNDNRKRSLHPLVENGYKNRKLLDEKSVSDFAQLVKDVQAFRNDLAHGNAENTYGDTYSRIAKFIRRFEEVCIKRNILAIPSGLSDAEKLQRGMGTRR
ncbi:TM1812 family CRISPR-associated protein [Desulfurispirillum indicum]|nr:TM1812 family CRISPR-associated protein [Desulfurispirillum indicum]